MTDAWIKTKDQKPSQGQRVLGINMDEREPRIKIIEFLKPEPGFHDSEREEWFLGNDPDQKPTHWMPLPEIPEPTGNIVPLHLNSQRGSSAWDDV